MNRKVIWMLVAIGVLFAGLAGVAAQEIQPTGNPAVTSPDLYISFPPPVYAHSGPLDIWGTVNVVGLSNYFIEFRPIDLGENAPVDPPWFPATIPQRAPVLEGSLGVWDTSLYADGLYEIRLVAVLSDSTRQEFVVSPLRIANTLELPGNINTGISIGDSFAATATALAQIVNATPSGPPTALPTPTSGAAQGPSVTALVNANVRSGDSTLYPTVGSLLRGEEAPVLSISSTGSGWFYILLDSGRRGFISPSTVSFNGDRGSLGTIAPPPVPVTATPVPTSTPAAAPDLHFTAHNLTPPTPTCGVAFNVNVTIQNRGNAPTNTGSTIEIRDIHQASGTVTTSVRVGFPVLGPGQSYSFVQPLTVTTFFDELHSAQVIIDPDNIIPESNESNNVSDVVYTLQKGGCG
jgi:hypothetical protein